MLLHALVIVDSAPDRQALAEILQDHAAIASVRYAGSAEQGRQFLQQHACDLVLLVLPLAERDGLALLTWLHGRPQGPAAIAVVRPVGRQDELQREALHRGALEVVCGPATSDPAAIASQLRTPLKGALASVRLARTRRQARDANAARLPVVTTSAAPVPPPPPVSPPPVAVTTSDRSASPAGGFWITAIASSTGGPEALARLLPELPARYPHPIVVVQHMPPQFTASLAANLDRRCRLHVQEARHGAMLTPGNVYIAPGGRHLKVRRQGSLLLASLDDSPPECSVKPSANVLFRSLATAGGVAGARRVLAIVLTGMGDDGCEGVRVLKRGACHCLAQDERSCVVYGMPRAVVEAGLADEVVPLARLAERVSALNGIAEVCP